MIPTQFRYNQDISLFKSYQSIWFTAMSVGDYEWEIIY